MTTTTKDKEKVLALGDFVPAGYRAWGRRRAKGLVRLAVNEHSVIFRGQQRFLISEE